MSQEALSLNNEGHQGLVGDIEGFLPLALLGHESTPNSNLRISDVQIEVTENSKGEPVKKLVFTIEMPVDNKNTAPCSATIIDKATNRIVSANPNLPAIAVEQSDGVTRAMFALPLNDKLMKGEVGQPVLNLSLSEAKPNFNLTEIGVLIRLKKGQMGSEIADYVDKKRGRDWRETLASLYYKTGIIGLEKLRQWAIEKAPLFPMRAQVNTTEVHLSHLFQENHQELIINPQDTGREIYIKDIVFNSLEFRVLDLFFRNKPLTEIRSEISSYGEDWESFLAQLCTKTKCMNTDTLKNWVQVYFKRDLIKFEKPQRRSEFIILEYLYRGATNEEIATNARMTVGHVEYVVNALTNRFGFKYRGEFIGSKVVKTTFETQQYPPKKITPQPVETPEQTKLRITESLIKIYADHALSHEMVIAKERAVVSDTTLHTSLSTARGWVADCLNLPTFDFLTVRKIAKEMNAK